MSIEEEAKQVVRHYVEAFNCGDMNTSSQEPFVRRHLAINPPANLTSWWRWSGSRSKAERSNIAGVQGTRQRRLGSWEFH